MELDHGDFYVQQGYCMSYAFAKQSHPSWLVGEIKTNN